MSEQLKIFEYKLLKTNHVVLNVIHGDSESALKDIEETLMKGCTGPSYVSSMCPLENILNMSQTEGKTPKEVLLERLPEILKSKEVNEWVDIPIFVLDPAFNDQVNVDEFLELLASFTPTPDHTVQGCVVLFENLPDLDPIILEELGYAYFLYLTNTSDSPEINGPQLLP